MIIHSPIVSGSLTFANGATFTLPTGGVYSGSFSGSYQGATFTGGTYTGDGSGLTFGGTGIVSGSSQLTTDFDARYLNTGGDGIVSSSAQVTSLLPTGTISGSSQVNADSITNFDTNVKDKLDVEGVISGSSQIVTILGPLNTFTSSQETKNSTLATYTGSIDTKFTTLETYTSSLETKNSTLASVTASLLSSQTNLNTYTGSLLNAIQVTGSRVNFLGDIVVYGTQSIINSQNVQIADNILYLSPTASVDNDLGIVGHYNDGTYKHAGIFMDASDGHAWKVFNGLQDETIGTVNTSGTGFTLADFKGGVFTGTSFNGSINATNGVVSGSSQITLSSTTGGGTSANVQFGSLGIGMAASGTAGRIDAINDIVAYSSSDRRFKENITPIPNALDKISKISGNTYDWKEENKIEHGYEGNDVGVIAQEIEEVLPQLVQTRESGYKAVKYDKLVALLIEGIKEQQSQIEELKNKIQKLENGL